MEGQARAVLPAGGFSLHGKSLDAQSASEMDNRGRNAHHAIKPRYQRRSVVVVVGERRPRILNKINARMFRTKLLDLALRVLVLEADESRIYRLE